MSASCDMTINFHGSDSDFEKLLDKLFEIEGARRDSIVDPYWPFYVKDHTITADNGSCRNVWGRYYLDPDADMFMKMAMAVPEAAFDVKSYRIHEGGGRGCQTFVKVHYKDRRLEFKTQKYVSYLSLYDLCRRMRKSNGFEEELRVVVLGKTKLFENREELVEYMEDYGAEVQTSVDKRTHFVVCNNPDSKSKDVAKAKEMDVQIISEMEFIRMFGDIYDFDDEKQMKLIVSDLTYEDFCDFYQVDETVTKERFEELLRDPDRYRFVVTHDTVISWEGHWDTHVYILNNNGEFVKEI